MKNNRYNEYEKENVQNGRKKAVAGKETLV